MRLRKVRKYGNSYFIALSVVDIKDFELEEGDEIDVEDCLVIKNNNKNKEEK